MFDKLIESNTAQAEFKPRRKFFMVSSVVVGILFLSAVVFSLYAQELDLGTDNFELVQLLAPVAPDAPEPVPPPRPQPQQQDQSRKPELPSRPELIARMDQPQEAPTTISTVPNRVPPMPLGAFTFDPSRASSDGVAGRSGPAGTEPGSSSATESVAVEPVKAADPPPIPKAEPKKPTMVTKGVINGEAISLPKPPYPAHARAVGVAGDVNVQILINEQGTVVSAKAVSGPALLKGEAERAAWKARFKPTYLSEVPVKVTGVIVYRFTR